MIKKRIRDTKNVCKFILNLLKVYIENRLSLFEEWSFLQGFSLIKYLTIKLK